MNFPAPPRIVKTKSHVRFLAWFIAIFFIGCFACVLSPIVFSTGAVTERLFIGLGICLFVIIPVLSIAHMMRSSRTKSKVDAKHILSLGDFTEEGIVKRVQDFSDSEGSSTRYVTYEFPTPRGPVESTTKANLQVGDRVTVFYLPDKPSQSVLYDCCDYRIEPGTTKLLQ